MSSLWLANCLAATLLASSAFGQTPYPTRLKWWADARFGMFIHWGPVSLTGQEISWSRANTNSKCPNNGPIPAAEYDNLYKRFDPEKFDATEWVRIAKAAGMKYMVLTAKHCDGFLLWNSKVSDYNIMHTPFHRDVCGELAKAAHKAGMRIGWYFSPMDWKDPDCRNAGNDEFVKRMQAELRELLTNYGRIDLLWFDTDGQPAPWDQTETYAMVRKLQPGIVINNRLDLGLDANPGSPSSLGPKADYYTPEQFVGAYDTDRPWESCMTMSAKGQWSYGGDGDGVKPLDTLLGMLVSCAGGDGNMLLDVGPMPDGRIPPIETAVLSQMGDWLHRFGSTIYGTRGGPFRPGAYGVSTRRGNRVYVHIRQSANGTVVLPPLAARIKSSRVLTGGWADVKQTDSAISISGVSRDKPSFEVIVELDLDRSAMDLSTAETPPGTVVRD